MIKFCLKYIYKNRCYSCNSNLAANELRACDIKAISTTFRSFITCDNTEFWILLNSGYIANSL